MNQAKPKYNTALKTPEYKLITSSRVFRDVNSGVDTSDDPFENFEINYVDIDRFEVIKPIGSGKYSIVFMGRHDGTNECAIKALRNVPFIKIQREICIHQQVASIPNVVPLIGVVKDPLTSTISIITKYQKTDNPRILYAKLSLQEIRILMYKLLLSLHLTASKGIMHRDVKPGNILVSPDKTNLELIDWGLADMYFPEKPYTTHVSTMRYKAPELLLNYQYYDYGVDVWGAGCVMAEMLVKFPFFEGRNLDEMIIQVAQICGTDLLIDYRNKYGLTFSQTVLSQIKPHQPSSWDRMMNSIKAPKRNDDAVNLLKQLLTIDHMTRISAEEALQHPFFDPVRAQFSDLQNAE